MQALGLKAPRVALLPACRRVVPFVPTCSAKQLLPRRRQQQQKVVQQQSSSASLVPGLPLATGVLSYLLSQGPAMAAAVAPQNPFEGVQSNSLYVTMVLFLMSVPGAALCRAACSGHGARSGAMAGEGGQLARGAFAVVGPKPLRRDRLKGHSYTAGGRGGWPVGP